MNKLDQIYLPVEKLRSEDLMPGYEFPSGINHAVVVTQADGIKRVVNYCSEIYHLVRNQEVIPLFLKQLSTFWEVDVQVKHNGSSQFFVDFVLTKGGIKLTKVDEVFPKLRYHNSYDGRIKYHFALGFHRKICSNGMTIPVGDSNVMIKKLHTPSLEALTSFEKVFEMTKKFLGQANELSEVYFELNDRKLKDPHDRIEEVIEETDFPTSLHEDVQYRLTQEMDILHAKQATDWLVYNAFNYQLNHNDDIKTKELKREKIDMEVLTFLRDF